jgi:hypothetical protein
VTERGGHSDNSSSRNIDILIDKKANNLAKAQLNAEGRTLWCHLFISEKERQRDSEIERGRERKRYRERETKGCARSCQYLPLVFRIDF